MVGNLHGEWCGEHSVTKCELGQSYVGKEKDEKKKKSLKVDTVLSKTALKDIALLHTPSVSTNIFHIFFCKVSQSYTFLDLY